MVTITEPLTPDDIDLGFVAELVPDLEMATIGDEQVVIGGATQLVVLNPTAALIFRFLDGEASLGELVDDFTEVLGVDRKVVEGDVLTFVRDLGANGLLEGVALPTPEMPEWDDDWTPPEVLAPGDELDDFTLPDLDGRRAVALRLAGQARPCWSTGARAAGSAWRSRPSSRRWHRCSTSSESTSCSWRSATPTPTARSSTTPGWRAPLLLRDDTDVDPFAGTGTPAAYLLDEDGRLVETMVVGSDQVPKLARDLAGVDPGAPYGVTRRRARRGRGPPRRRRARAVPPRAGRDVRPRWRRRRRQPHRLEGHAGVRDRRLPRRSALRRRRDRRGARPSVPRRDASTTGAFPTTTRSRSAARRRRRVRATSRSLKLLVHGSTQLVRSRSGGRVLAGLAAAPLGRPRARRSCVHARRTRLRWSATERRCSCPPACVDFVKQLQPRLAKAGLCIVDTPRTLLDLSTRELVVPEPTVPHDESVVAELDEGVKLGSELPWVRPGPLSAAHLVPRPQPRAHGSSEHRGRGDRGVADALRARRPRRRRRATRRPALGGRDVTGIWYESADDLVDQVVAGLR